MTAHSCLMPGNTWAECLCNEIDPADVPCIVCECRENLESQCDACLRIRARATSLTHKALDAARSGSGR